jgi:hypothetical protein
MQKTIFNLRNVAMVACLAVVMMFTACGGDEETKPINNGGGDEPTTEQNVEAAFAQFGLELDKVKPNVATPNETTIKYSNTVDETVYYRKAAWQEQSETDISSEVGNDYNERMFDYMKSVAADGKIYTNKTMSDSTEEIASYQYFIDKAEGEIVTMVTWSYKYDGMWIDVYLDYAMKGSDIGVSLNGSGSY